MQAIGNMPKYSSRSRVARSGVALLFVLTMCFCATIANATSPKPAIVVSQVYGPYDFSGGGFTGGSDYLGGSLGVNPGGDVVTGTTYGAKINLFVNGAGTPQSFSPNGVGMSVGLDSKGNIYASEPWWASTTIWRIPYVDGAYVITGGGGTCKGTSTDQGGPCSLPFSPADTAKALAFDPNGNLFFLGYNTNKIFEVTAANLYTSNAPVTIYTDSNYLGSIAFDQTGNLFFTDAAWNTSTNYSSDSWLEEMHYTGSGYAAPVPLVHETPPSGSSYQALEGVATDQNGTVYFSDQKYGVFAFPNPLSGQTTALTAAYATANTYLVANQSSYQIAFDGKGNLFAAGYDNIAGSPALYKIALNNLAIPASPVGTASNTPAGGTQTGTAPHQNLVSGEATVFVTDGSPTVTGVANANGETTTEFGFTLGAALAAPASSYTSAPGSAIPYASIFNVTPAHVGQRNANIVLTTANGGTGTVAATTVGEGALATLDPGALTASYSTGFSTPTSVSVDAAGDMFIADQGNAEVFEIPAGSPSGTTPTSIGSGFANPESTAIDAYGNLYIGDAGTGAVYEIANTSTTGGFTPGATATTVVAPGTLFGGKALGTPVGLAIGPDGVLYISDESNNRVVTYNLANGFISVRAAGTGLANPVGIAVDATGKLYVANQSADNVLVYSGGTITTLSLSATSVTAPAAIAVDASGSVLVGDSASGNIVRIPNVAGTLTIAGAATVYTNPDTAVGIALDGAGNLYSADSSGMAVYEVSRTQASVNFGPVSTGATSDLPVYVESAGNLALDTPTIGSAPAPFALVAQTATPDCGNGTFATTIAAGSYCEVTAEFTAPGPNLAVSNGSGTLTFTNAQFTTASIALTGSSATASGSTPQQITFQPLATPVAFTTTPIPLYATASSLLPVTFTLSAGSPAAITASASAGYLLTFANYGTVVVTANQYGNGTYLAAPPVTYTVVVTPLGTTATPALSLPANTYTFVPQTISITDTTPGAVIYYTVTSGTTGTTPTTASSVYSGPISITATETIESLAVAPGYKSSAVATATYGINVLPATFGVAFNSPTVTIPSQQAGAIDVIVTPANGFNGTVTLSVTGLPSGATSSFTPPTLALSGAASKQSVLTVSFSPSAALHRPSSPWVPGTALAFALCFFGWKKRRSVLQLHLLLVVGLVGLGLLGGCGGSSKAGASTSSTVTVTATAGSIVESATFSLTVTQN